VNIPEKGQDQQAVLAELDGLHKGDADWRGARTFSLVYYKDARHSAFLIEAYAKFFSENFLNPMAFKSLKKMESEVVRMTASLFHGDDNVVGTMTSGGTESLLLVVQAMRDRAGIKNPEIVLPISAHPAFDKAAHYFGVTLRHAPLKSDYSVDVDAMKRLINKNTVMLAASAPQYPHGVMDSIEDIAKIALERGLPFHVDACIGGFMLPWVEKLGYPVPPFDFRVPGVTSMSADVHKYGFAAKGASVILYKDMSYLEPQFFVATEFPGGIYASPGMAGTRPGGAIAAAWAALKSIGQNGYLETAKSAMETTKAFAEGIRSIPGLEILGNPVMSLLAFKSADPTLNIFSIAERLEQKGWDMCRQQKPASIHLTLTAHHATVKIEFLRDLREAADWARAHPGAAAEGSAAMYGMAARLPARGLVRDGVMKVMREMYGPKGAQFAPAARDRAAEAASRFFMAWDKVKSLFTPR
jgi:glutamate/tyrosine decarboxylase-like PLP-dependent enzyme